MSEIITRSPDKLGGFNSKNLYRPNNLFQSAEKLFKDFRQAIHSFKRKFVHEVTKITLDGKVIIIIIYVSLTALYNKG